jgi:hypothetical protein
VSSGEPDFPFCIGWANQSWTGIWHGAPNRMLIEQTYPGPDDHRRHFESLYPTFADARYLEVDGRKLLYIFRPNELPEVERTIELWRELADDAGLGGLYIVGHSWSGSENPFGQGFDASVAFYLRSPERSRFRPTRRGPRIVSFEEARWTMTSLGRDMHQPCVLPRWDNTPRSGRRGLVVQGATPEAFRDLVQHAAGKVELLPAGERLLWLKSWNEWAEGNTMEPDQQFGHGYLDALHDGLTAPVPIPPEIPDWTSLDRMKSRSVTTSAQQASKSGARASAHRG